MLKIIILTVIVCWENVSINIIYILIIHTNAYTLIVFNIIQSNNQYISHVFNAVSLWCVIVDWKTRYILEMTLSLFFVRIHFPTTMHRCTNSNIDICICQVQSRNVHEWKWNQQQIQNANIKLSSFTGGVWTLKVFWKKLSS